MNYTDGSPSFPSAVINSAHQGQFMPNVNYPMPPDDINNQPPSQGSLAGYGQWNSQNQFQGGGTTGYRGFQGPPDEIDEREKSPSLTDMGRANHSNQFQTGYRSLGYSGGYGTYADQAPDFDDMARGNISNPSGGGGGLYTGENKPPTISDVGQRDNSQTGGGGSSTISQISPEDQAFVGMSLVGKNFKRFYPNAYYKEKDDQN